MKIGLEIPPGIYSDDTSFSRPGRWIDGNNTRFRLGQPETIGGHESLTTDLLTGVCRNALPWTDNDAALNVGLGTHSNLYVYRDGLYDITPTLARPSFTLAANPVATTNTTATIVLTVPAGHGLQVDDSITLAGLSAVATVTINGTWTLTAVGDTTVTFTAGSNANATTTGGGSSGVCTPQEAFATGSIDGTGGAGFGTGTWGTGTYSSPSEEDFYPRTWALDAFGQQLLASPRGGALYLWANDTATPAAPVANSPRQCSFALVGPNDELFAFGCNEETSGERNYLCIRHSGVRGALGPNHTVWNTDPSTTAREYILPGGGRIVGARKVGRHLFVWTTHSLFLGQYVGQPNQVWRFDRIGLNCGLIGPNAAVVVGQSAYWFSPDMQFRFCDLGGAPGLLPCPIRKDMVDNLVLVQGDKIVASSNSHFNEIRFDYPDSRDGTENSRYVAASVDVLRNAPDQAWYRGTMARSAFVDAGSAGYPIGVSPSGNVYYHERGRGADGSALSWSLKSADLYLHEDLTGTVLGLWPDIEDQAGTISITLTSRLKPQADERAQYSSMTVGQDKVDLRLSGRLFNFEFSGSDTTAFARFGKIAVEFVPGGKR